MFNSIPPVEAVQKPSLRDHSDGVGRRSNLGGGLNLSTQIATGFALAMTGWPFFGQSQNYTGGAAPLLNSLLFPYLAAGGEDEYLTAIHFT